jgi:hypothetical protein
MPMQIQRGGRGIPPSHLQPNREGGGWSAPHTDHLTPMKDSITLVQEAGWTLGPVWMEKEILPQLGLVPLDHLIGIGSPILSAIGEKYSLCTSLYCM